MNKKFQEWLDENESSERTIKKPPRQSTSFYNGKYPEGTIVREYLDENNNKITEYRTPPKIVGVYTQGDRAQQYGRISMLSGQSKLHKNEVLPDLDSKTNPYIQTNGLPVRSSIINSNETPNQRNTSPYKITYVKRIGDEQPKIIRTSYH